MYLIILINTNVSTTKLKEFVNKKLKKHDNICIIIGYQSLNGEDDIINSDNIEKLWDISKDLYYTMYNNVFFVYFSKTKNFTDDIRNEINKQSKLIS